MLLLEIIRMNRKYGVFSEFFPVKTTHTSSLWILNSAKKYIVRSSTVLYSVEVLKEIFLLDSLSPSKNKITNFFTWASFFVSSHSLISQDLWAIRYLVQCMLFVDRNKWKGFEVRRIMGVEASTEKMDRKIELDGKFHGAGRKFLYILCIHGFCI